MFAENTMSKFFINQLVTFLKSGFSLSQNRLAFFYDDVGDQSIMASNYEGEMLVPLAQIVGSMNAGRSRDFDANFKLLGAHSQDRLARVEAANRRKALPPVWLIQIGRVFYVQDGHHRVSIAKAKGQREILAKVTAVVLEPTVTNTNLAPMPA